tara:strand:+ start:269 stop:766 length:498 start_codon:yes stop_codon:yes gene_type:complete
MKNLMELSEEVKATLNWDFLIHAKWELSPIVDDYFLKTIWATSTTILPHLEVQVVVDDDNKIHVSRGTGSFVSFQVNPVGMKLPIKCWIHTHPFGAAYWSGTDWSTIDTWRPMMKQAIVLGDRQKGIWNQGEGYSWVWHNEKTGESVERTETNPSFFGDLVGEEE